LLVWLPWVSFFTGLPDSPFFLGLLLLCICSIFVMTLGWGSITAAEITERKREEDSRRWGIDEKEMR
jgi:hypothetical protein